MFVGVCGIIGVGKTTLTEKIATEMNFTPYFEPVKENVYLADFYKDPEKYGAMMQLFLLSKRFEQHQTIVWQGGDVIQDRTIYEDTIFATMLKDANLISTRDYETYISHFNIMKRYLVYPDLMLYLNTSAEKAYERVLLRNRKAEETLTLDYLVQLKKYYDDFVDKFSKHVNIVVVNYDEFPNIDSIKTVINAERKNDMHDFRRNLLKI